jgi:hypothetical protein
MIQPKIIKIAVSTYFIVVALSFFSAIPNYLAADPRPSLIGVLITWSVIYGFLIWLGLAIKGGKNWARHLNAVITIASLVSVFFLGTSPSLSTDISQIIMLINYLASAVVVVLLYTSPSNAWFKSVET